MKSITRAGIVLLTTISLVSSVSAASFNSNLSLGARGDEVKKVQDFLIAQGFLSGVSTGYFGNQTRMSIQSFQRNNGLPSSGFWFPMTRQKAEYVLSHNTPTKTTVSGTSSTQISLPPFNSKDNKLTIYTSSGGYVSSSENKTDCFTEEICQLIFPESKKITLKANPLEGYAFKGWSETSCSNSFECIVSVVGSTTIQAKFEVSQFKKTGSILSVKHPSDTCYILTGTEKCNLNITWATNFGQGGVKISIDGTERYVRDMAYTDYSTANYDPKVVSLAQSQRATGLLYIELGLFPAKHKIALTLPDEALQPLDTVEVEVKCAPGTIWTGSRCSEPGSNILYVFKSNDVIIKSSSESINCGYLPEMCNASFSSTTMVTLTATPRPGHTFAGWTGDCSGKEQTCTLLMNKPRNVGVVN